jgi:hypothetical protein
MAKPAKFAHVVYQTRRFNDANPARTWDVLILPLRSWHTDRRAAAMDMPKE